MECGKTWERLAAETPFDNLPRAAATWRGIEHIAAAILDPVTDGLGRPTLTYGFASPRLARQIRRGIAPRLDQHAGAEVTRGGRQVCERGGQAVDICVHGHTADALVERLLEATEFDRLYIYGLDRPVHVSASQSPRRQIVLMLPRVGRTVPRVVAEREIQVELRRLLPPRVRE